MGEEGAVGADNRAARASAGGGTNRTEPTGSRSEAGAASSEKNHGPYKQLLQNTPETIHETLVRAEDGRAAIGWLRHGRTPKETVENGSEPGRTMLTGWGKSADGVRWVEYNGERYVNEEDDFEALQEAVDIGSNKMWGDFEIPERTPFHWAMICMLSGPARTYAEEFEGEWHAQTIYAVIEYPMGLGPQIYRGLFQTRREVNTREAPEPEKDDPVWLNARAERVLAATLAQDQTEAR